MDIKDYTIEMLKAENPELCASIATAAVQEERARIQEIDELTMPGYEELAARAKADGTSALDFHKAVVRAQKERGNAFMTQRTEETAKAAEVTGGAPEDVNRNDDAEAIREIADYAKRYTGKSGDMF